MDGGSATMFAQEIVSEADFGPALAERLAQASAPADHPAAVADLFRLAYVESPDAAELGRRLRADLFRRTLGHATREVPYYRGRFPYRDLLERHDWLGGAPIELRALPVIARSDLQAEPDSFLAEDVDTGWISHTAGSTGAPVSIPRSAAEVRFQQSFFQKMMDEAARRLPSRPLVLTFPNAYHGVATPLPSLGKVFSAGVTDDVLIEDAARVLREEYRFPGHDRRISILSGLGFHIAFFTSYLFDRGIDPAECGIRGINVTGAHLPSSLRQYLERSWQAQVNDRFTLTEIAGGATRGASDSPFRVDPYCLAEAVDADSGEPIREGVGLLVMSSLHPFVQRQPMIRYRTGDLVRVRAHDGASVTAFDFLGKAGNCLSVEERGRTIWVLYSASLNDALADLPDVRLYDWFNNVRAAADPSVGSQPLVRSTRAGEGDGPIVLSIEAELRYAPSRYPERLSALQAHVEQELLRSNPDLERLVRTDALRLSVRFVPPGRLGAAVAFKI